MAVYVDEINYDGKHDLDEEIAVIKWCIADLLDMMAYEGMELTDDNIDRILSNRFRKTLEERSTEEGWDIIRDLVWMAE